MEEIKSELDTSTRKSILQIINIMRPFSNPSMKELYGFFVKIRGIDDNIIKGMIDRYFTDKHYVRKGISYLASMIYNKANNIQVTSEIEEKIYGKRPPIKDVS